MKRALLGLLCCALLGTSFSQNKPAEDSINKITALLDTNKLSKVLVKTNVFNEYPDLRTQGRRTGKRIASYYADPSKELKIVAILTSYDSLPEKLITTYFFDSKNIIKMEVVKLSGNPSESATTPNEYYYVAGRLASKNESFPLITKRYDVLLLSTGLSSRDYYYKNQKQ